MEIFGGTFVLELMSMKIAIYSICKNEEKNVARFLEMSQEADLVCVLDTGSTDSTLSKLRDGHPNLIIKQVTLDPWRFDTARNLSLEMVPIDYDLVAWMDLDEYYAPGWRAQISAAFDPSVTRYTNKFKNLNSSFEYYHFKFHKRKNCRWRYPIHEQLQFDGPEKNLLIEDLICEHSQDLKKDKIFYISMILKYLDSNELPRKEYVPLLIRELFVNKQFGNCCETFLTYKELIDTQIDKSKKANCYRYYITSLEEIDRPRSVELILEYAQIFPVRDHYYVAAWAMRKIKQYDKALELLRLGDLNHMVDLNAEFIHPSARTPKYELLRTNINKEIEKSN